MRLFVCSLMAALFMTAAAMSGDIELPPPQKAGGPPLFDAMDRRASAPGNAFPSGMPSLQELSTILWAASGQNRDGVKWTVPMAMGRPPYCRIYVTMDSGTYRYDWEKNVLAFVSGENPNTVLPAQAFVRNAPVALYLVLDAAAIGALSGKTVNEFGPLLAGAMSQNIYLACEGLGIGTRLVYSIDRAKAATSLALPAGDTALFVMPLGKRP